MKHFVSYPKLQKGDQVGVVSPSNGLPGLFPWVFELGLERLQNDFGLVPQEYPTTRRMGAPLQDRARDVMEAFADPNNKAVMTSIGGSDQIRLLKFLDPKVFLDNPKPFFGFSDNTHLHVFLWNLGIPTYYGGAIMTQFGMNESMHDLTVRSLRHALFDTGEQELEVSREYNDIGLSWADQKSLAMPRPLEENEGLVWEGTQSAEGILWGGCIESLVAQVSTTKYLPDDDDLNGVILCLESSENMPPDWVVEYLLTGFGERGWFERFAAVLVGRPKAWDFQHPLDAAEKHAYKQSQCETIVRTVRHYNQAIPIVQNLDFGHTDPQTALPFGRLARIDSGARKITLTY